MQNRMLNAHFFRGLNEKEGRSEGERRGRREGGKLVEEGEKFNDEVKGENFKVDSASDATPA